MLANILNKAKSITNPSLQQLEATIAGCLIVALGDGDMSPAEEDQIRRGIEHNEALRPLLSKVDGILDKYEAALTNSKRGGMRQLRGQLRDVGNTPDVAMDVFTLVLDVADHGGIDPAKELPRLAIVASELGIMPATIKREFDLDLPAVA